MKGINLLNFLALWILIDWIKAPITGDQSLVKALETYIKIQAFQLIQLRCTGRGMQETILILQLNDIKPRLNNGRDPRIWFQMEKSQAYGALMESTPTQLNKVDWVTLGFWLLEQPLLNTLNEWRNYFWSITIRKKAYFQFNYIWWVNQSSKL